MRISPKYPACAEHASFIAHRSRVVARKEPTHYGDLLTATGDRASVLIEQLEWVKPRGVLAGKHQRGAAPVLVNQPNGDAITGQFADERPARPRGTGGCAQQANWTRRRQAVGSPPSVMRCHRQNVLAEAPVRGSYRLGLTQQRRKGRTLDRAAD